MFNNRKYINELIKYNEKLLSENEKLVNENEGYKRKEKICEDEMIKSMDSRDSYRNANRKLINDIGKLKKDIENKENSVCNVLEANKELSQHNNFLENQNLLLNKENAKLTEEIKVLKKERDSYKELHKKEYENFEKAYSLARKHRDKISMLEKVIRKHENNECDLNTKLCRYKGMLDKMDNYTRMLEGRGINE